MLLLLVMMILLPSFLQLPLFEIISALTSAVRLPGVGVVLVVEFRHGRRRILNIHIVFVGRSSAHDRSLTADSL
jgi:hypothetical protein